MNTKFSNAKPEWFGNNCQAMQVYDYIVECLHTIDDLVDKDKEIDSPEIIKTFLIAFAYLQSNPFYQSISPQIIPMWITTAQAYEASLTFEKTKDEHGLEIAHILRYLVGQIATYMSFICLGYDKAQEQVPAIWKQVVFERYEHYKQEHLKEQSNAR
jgi:hypothetical protein